MGAVVMTKDRYFVDMVERVGPPPQVLRITSGNASNQQLRRTLGPLIPHAIERLAAGEPLVEIG